MATSLTIGGSSVTLATLNSWPTSLVYRFRGYSTLTIQRRGGPLPGLPDPWLGKTVALAIGGTTYFTGDIVSVHPSFTGLGWVNTYQCMDLKKRGDNIPFTDSNTLTDTAAFNLQPDDPAMVLSRMGRNVGQILTEVLTMLKNATVLDALGIGGYTSLSPPTLPSATTTDLAALTIIPPSSVYVQGEKLINAIEAFVRYWCPNFIFWIEPNGGKMRFLDQRTFSNHTLTLGTDPIEPPMLSRSVVDCFQRVIVRGQPIAEPKMVDTILDSLEEDFAWGSYDNAGAKAAWTPADGLQNTTAIVEGTCTCTDTLNIVVDPTDAGVWWSTNFWDQTSTGHLGVIMLTYSAGSGIDLTVTRRIVSNAALTAGSTASLTVDLALPNTNYDKFSIYGVVNGAGLVWRKYKVKDTTIAAAMANQFTYPTPWVGSSGNVAVMISYPMGSVCWSNSGTPPFAEWPSWFTQDPDSGHIYFQQPTYVTCGNHVPSNVRALLAINTGELQAIYPPNTGSPPITPAYGGTSNTVEGLENTLTVTVGQWRDPINQTAMNAFAHDLFDSVSDTVIEGSVVYHGYYGTALTPGQALSVTGNGYTTGWESLALPIQEVELTWNSGSLTQFTTVMHVSNRRSHYTSGQFLRPDRWVGGQPIAAQGGFGWQAALGVDQSVGGSLVGFGQDVGGGTAGAFDSGGTFSSVINAMGMSGEGEAEFGFEALGTGVNAARGAPRARVVDQSMGAAVRASDQQEIERDQAENARRAAARQREDLHRKAQDRMAGQDMAVADEALDEHLRNVE